MFASTAYARENTKEFCQGKNYKSSIVPKKMTAQEKKRRFRCLVQPFVKEVFSELTLRYNKVLKAVNQGADNTSMKHLRTKYKVKTNQELLKAIKPHLKSIAMAQAAMESAWGTSKFFSKANNIFGMWSFNKNEPRIAASKKRGKKTVWVKKYPSIKASVEDYYLLLARGRAFSEFRNLKMKTANPYKLAGQLNAYSERGGMYEKSLAAIIRQNKLYELD